jgi:hypothetical protein
MCKPTWNYDLFFFGGGLHIAEHVHMRCLCTHVNEFACADAGSGLAWLHAQQLKPTWASK